MPQNVYARAAKRGFPVFDMSGQSGQGALQDSTAPPQEVGLPTAEWTDPNLDPGYVATGTPPPEEFQLGLTLWGLPAAADPDNTPRGHAAPVADPTLPIGEYYGEADATHAQQFTGVALTRPSWDGSWIGSQKQFGFDQQLSEGNGETLLVAAPDQLRGNAPFDGVQGFGGGGPGPGGTNLPELTTLQRDFPGPEGGGVQAFVSANEVPFLVAVPDQFIPTDTALGTWYSNYDSPTTDINAQDPVGSDTPAQGPPLSSGVPAYTNSFWG